jgi:hypothetical protein
MVKKESFLKKENTVNEFTQPLKRLFLIKACAQGKDHIVNWYKR